MNKPKEMPSLSKPFTPMSVSAGLHRLPGESFFEKPSMNTTKVRRTVEAIPRIEVYDKSERGRNTVGISLDQVVK